MSNNAGAGMPLVPPVTLVVAVAQAWKALGMKVTAVDSARLAHVLARCYVATDPEADPGLRVALAEAVDSGGIVIDPGADPLELRRSLVAVAGIGPWTAEYVAMRALRDPDAFMPTDLGIRRAARAIGLPDDPAQLVAASESWRPWRSYAMAHLWALPAPTAEIPTRPAKGRAA